MIDVLVNGESRRLTDGASVADAVRQILGDDGESAEKSPLPTGIAVALGDDVVPAGRWSTTRLQPGDRLEVLGAVAGG